MVVAVTVAQTLTRHRDVELQVEPALLAGFAPAEEEAAVGRGQAAQLQEDGPVPPHQGQPGVAGAQDVLVQDHAVLWRPDLAGRQPDCLPPDLPADGNQVGAAAHRPALGHSDGGGVAPAAVAGPRPGAQEQLQEEQAESPGTHEGAGEPSLLLLDLRPERFFDGIRWNSEGLQCCSAVGANFKVLLRKNQGAITSCLLWV